MIKGLTGNEMRELEGLVDELTAVAAGLKTGSRQSFAPVAKMSLMERIMNAMDYHYTASLDYVDADGVKTFRDIVVYAYGLSLAGNPVIRAYITFGDSTSGRRPYWRLFRIDRIRNFTANRKSVRQNKPHALFNPNGDGKMSVVYRIAKWN